MKNPRNRKDPDPIKKIIKGKRYPGIGTFKTEKTRTTSGGLLKPYEFTTQSMDTTGYSKGKQNFKLVTTKGTGDLTGGKIKSKSVKSVSRNNVPSTLKKLENRKSGGVIKSKKKNNGKNKRNIK